MKITKDAAISAFEINLVVCCGNSDHDITTEEKIDMVLKNRNLPPCRVERHFTYFEFTDMYGNRSKLYDLKKPGKTRYFKETVYGHDFITVEQTDNNNRILLYFIAV